MRTRIVAIGMLLLCATTLILAQRTTGEDLFQRGLDQERGKRDIPAAIKIYEDILKQFPNNRALMAKTLAQLGDCYEKLGQTKAQDYYQQVIAKYPDQSDMVAKARARLTTLTGPPAAGPVTRFEFALPQGTRLAHGFRTGVDISPDGKRIAFVAAPFAPNPVGPVMIYVKSTEDVGQTTAVPGTAGGYNPFFSPDGEWLGFFSGIIAPNNPSPRILQISKVKLSGGPPVVLLNLVVGVGDYADNVGATWGPDGTIVFGSFTNGLKWIPEEGGQPQLLTRLDASANEVSHRLPHFLPDGSGVLFTVLHYSPHTRPITNSKSQIWVAPKNGNPKLLLEDGMDARAGNNSLLFARNGKLFSVGFNAKTLSVSGSPAPVVDDGVVHSTNNIENGTRTGAAQYSVSQNGSLIYASGSTEPVWKGSVVFVDESGKTTPLAIQPRQYSHPRVSPDGSNILLSSNDGLWLYDSEGLKRVESPPEITDFGPAIWSPDGTRLAFMTYQAPIVTYLKELRSSNLKRLVSGYWSPMSWTPDGRELAVLRRTSNKTSIHVLAVEKPDEIKALLEDPRVNYSQARFSPDGRWLAYCSDEAGANRVYVQPYPGPGPRVPVSPISLDVRLAPNPAAIAAKNRITGGAGNPNPSEAALSRIAGPAANPVWSRDGKRLFYRFGPYIVSTNFKVVDGEFIPEASTALFLAASFVNSIVDPPWDVTPDGRFVMIQQESAEDTQERQRKILPSTLVLMTPANQRITLGPNPTNTPAAGSDNTVEAFLNQQSQQLVVYDRQGRHLSTIPPILGVVGPRPVVPAISPDGARIAVGFNREILIFEAGEGKVAQIISGNPLPPPFLGGNLAWSPDGRRIAYISNQASGAGVYIRPSDGSGKAELLSSTQATNLLWSAERFLTLNPRDSRGPFAILPIEGDMKSIDIKGSFDVSPRLSPDGRFIAWSALSTTPNEVDIYVRPFESSAADTVSDNVRWRIATGAREVYRWRADGKELYYLSNNGGVMAVPITTSPEFKAGPPQLLFQAPQGILAPATGAQNVDLRMDISRNGQRFVFVLPPTADTSTRASARGVPSPSQSDGIGGSWQIAPGGPTFYLITDGTTLVGTMRKTEDRTTFSWPIFEGKVDGTTITFKVGASGMLTGKLNGNEISLSGDVQLPPGDPAIPIAGGSLNMRAVLEGILSRLPFVARRVQ